MASVVRVSSELSVVGNGAHRWTVNQMVYSFIRSQTWANMQSLLSSKALHVRMKIQSSVELLKYSF